MNSKKGKQNDCLTLALVITPLGVYTDQCWLFWCYCSYLEWKNGKRKKSIVKF